MKKSIYIFSIFLGLGFLLSSCESANEAEKTADQFFRLLIKGKSTEANAMVETGFDSQEQLEEVKSLGKNLKNGKLLSAKKSMGFNTRISNGITTVELPYTLKYSKIELDMQVVLVDRGKGYKITSIL